MKIKSFFSINKNIILMNASFEEGKKTVKEDGLNQDKLIQETLNEKQNE